MAHQMKVQLKALYQTHWDRIRSVKRRVKDRGPYPYGPFLLGFVEPCASQAVRLMVIGQQTKEWSCHDTIDKQMAVHEDFHNGRDYGHIFHDTSRRVEETLGIAKYSSVYGNLNRFDVDGGKPVGREEEIISELDFLLIEEIAILKPDVCLFLTGPSLDGRISRLFPGLERLQVKTWGERQLCQLQHPKLPKRSFRTYHPVSLRRQQLERRILEDLDRLITV